MREDFDLCNFSYTSYSGKCFNPIYRVLYNEGYQHGSQKVTQTYVIEFCYKAISYYSKQLDTKINTSSNPRTVLIAKV